MDAKKIKDLAVAVSVIAIAAAVWWFAVRLGPDLRAVAWNARTATYEVAQLARQAHEDYTAEDGYATKIGANLDTSAVIGRQSVEAIADTRALIADTRRALFAADGLLPEIRGLVADLRGTARAATSAIEQTSEDVHAVLVPLAGAVRNVERATAEAEEALRKGGPELERAAAALTKALTDLDAVIADPAIHGTLANLEHGTGSIKAALEPLRRTGGRLVKLLKFAAGRIQINPW